jgi:LAO/AO transport system kinase
VVPTSLDPADLARRVVARDRVAIGQALSLVEDRRGSSLPRILALLRALRESQAQSGALRIGLTGPPGAGKSSLVADIARELRRRARSVGVLAVDPSSPRSGGALLGDRSRIDPDPDDDSIFVRSMASGGDLGGLARAARSAVDVLSASHDVVLIETVGVGQNETDVELVADATVMVMQPASGDVLQFLKAGILEIPDLIVVNKIDLGEVAQRTRREFVSLMSAMRAAGVMGQAPEVFATSTVTHDGVGELVDAIEAMGARLASTGELMRRRATAEQRWAARLLARRVGEVGIEAIGGLAGARVLLDDSLGRGLHAIEAVAAVVDIVLSALSSTGGERIR